MSELFTAQLFLGFPLDNVISKKLNALNPALLSSYISDAGDEYLQEIHNNGAKYIGKKVAEDADLSELKLLELNIYSILNKLLPDYPSQQTSLVLLAYVS